MIACRSHNASVQRAVERMWFRNQHAIERATCEVTLPPGGREEPQKGKLEVQVGAAWHLGSGERPDQVARPREGPSWQEPGVDFSGVEL